MHVVELYRKLIAAAKAETLSERVPFAFEKRIMARIASMRPDKWAFWAGALWQAAAPCVLIMLLLSAWAALAPAPNHASDFSQDFDNTVLAAAAQDASPDSSQ